MQLNIIIFIKMKNDKDIMILQSNCESDHL